MSQSSASTLDGCFVANRALGRFVVLEGMPGAGKTTVARALGRRCRWHVVSELDHVGDGRATHAALTTSPGDFSWYLREESARQAASSAELRKGETVLFDRSVLSSIAFQYASQPAVVAVDTLAPLVTKYGPFLLPDAVVILLVDVETSLARRAQSSHNEQYAIWFDRAFLKRYLHFYQAVAASIFPSATFIETSAQMPHATESQVLEVLMHAGIRAEPPITS